MTAGLNKKQIAGVGIGLPGLVDYEKGIVRFLPNIPGWRKCPFKIHSSEKDQSSCFCR